LKIQKKKPGGTVLSQTPLLVERGTPLGTRRHSVVVSVLALINVVNCQHWARLVLEWVTVCR